MNDYTKLGPGDIYREPRDYSDELDRIEQDLLSRPRHFNGCCPYCLSDQIRSYEEGPDFCRCCGHFISDHDLGLLYHPASCRCWDCECLVQTEARMILDDYLDDLSWRRRNGQG